jgi:hydroxyacyl-ACP dehydratase HTD2-like protein with hotdog domain
MDKFLGTALNAPETVHALVVNRVNHLVAVKAPIVVYPIDTLLFHTDGTLETALFPGNDPRLGNLLEPVRSWLRMYHVFGWHLRILRILEI